MATRPQDAAARGSPPPEELRRWHFANAVLDERTCELLVDGKEVEVERKPFEVLRVLLRRAGEVVTKDDLLAAVWPGRILSETVLTKCISRLREVLRDEAQKVIKTTHGYGYRLVAAVTAEGSATPTRASAAAGMRVLLVEDHELFSDGIKHLLSDFAEGVSFRNAANCAQALKLAETSAFDIVLLDYHLPDLEGTAALRAIREKIPQATIVILSGETDAAKIREVIQAGAAGFIPKRSTTEAMIAALRLILAGETYLPAEAYLGMPGARPDASLEDSLDQLTHRQVLVLRLALQGKPNEVIASELQLPKAAVIANLDASFKALGVQNRTDALLEAARAKLQIRLA